MEISKFQSISRTMVRTLPIFPKCLVLFQTMRVGVPIHIHLKPWEVVSRSLISPKIWRICRNSTFHHLMVRTPSCGNPDVKTTSLYIEWIPACGSKLLLCNLWVQPLSQSSIGWFDVLGGIRTPDSGTI